MLACTGKLLRAVAATPSNAAPAFQRMFRGTLAACTDTRPQVRQVGQASVVTVLRECPEEQRASWPPFALTTEFFGTLLSRDPVAHTDALRLAFSHLRRALPLLPGPMLERLCDPLLRLPALHSKALTMVRLRARRGAAQCGWR